MQKKKTIKNSKLQINLALNYGSKLELINAFKRIKRSKIKINEKNLEKHLQTKNIPDPDILIRTGNTKRLSNFLLWQLAYSEIFFEKKLWPAFTEKDFNKIMIEYKNIKVIDPCTIKKNEIGIKIIELKILFCNSLLIISFQNFF